MRFLLDAQLPLRLAHQVSAAGHDVVHTSELRDGNRTNDAEIARRADAEDRVVVTKDRYFRDGHLLHSTPRRLHGEPGGPRPPSLAQHGSCWRPSTSPHSPFRTHRRAALSCYSDSSGQRRRTSP